MKFFRLSHTGSESRSRAIRLLSAMSFIAIITIIGLFLSEQLNSIYFKDFIFGDTHIITIVLGTVLTTLATLAIMLQAEGLNVKLSRENEERKQAEKALVKSRAILSRAQKIAHVGNWAWNLKTNGISWSDEIYKIFGYSPGEVQPSYDWLMSRVVPEDRPLIAASVEAALKEDRLFNIDYRITTKDDTIRYVNTVADRIKRDKAGNPEWMYGISQDITRRKEVEKELQDAKAQAELYIDLMGHDINNMNQIAMGYLELAYDRIENEGRLEKTDASLLEKPIDAMKNIARLVGNVKKLQREKLGEYEQKPVDVRRVLTDVIAQYSSVPGRDVRIHFRHAAGCLVLANDLLTDLYANIVGNAIKHSCGPLQIDIGQDVIEEQGVTYCRVVIEDTGPGISDDMKKSLMARLCTPNLRYMGRGLGLCIVKTLVDDFRGRMRIEDRVPGRHEMGARFVIMLPVCIESTEGTVVSSI